MVLRLCGARFLGRILWPSRLSRIQLCSQATTKLTPVQPERDRGTSDGVKPTEYSKAKPFNAIPTPRESWPVIGLLLEFGKRVGKAGDENIFNHLTHKYGPIWKISAFGQRAVVVCDAEATATIMRSEGKWPSRSPLMEDIFHWVHKKINAPEGLAGSSGANWRRLRTAMSKQVIPRRLSNFTSALYSISNDLCNHLTSIRNKEGVVVDLWPNMQNWALHGACQVVFNENIDVHSGKDPTSREVVEAALAFTEAFSLLQSSSPMIKIFPSKSYRQYVRCLQKMRTVGAKLLKKHLDDISADIKEGKVDETSAVGLLDQWLIEGKLSEDEAVMQAADMLAAGTDTTSNTATFMLHELAKNPETQEAVRREVMEVVGMDKEPTAEQLQQLPLVRGCVRETLRLYPITVVNSRLVTDDIVLMGYQIPAGTIAMPVTSLPGFDPHQFPNPERFDPHRWSRDAKDIHPFAAIPFGFGPRGCYGRRIAELELHLLIVRVLQRFQLSTKQSSLALKHFLLLRPDEPVMLCLTDKES